MRVFILLVILFPKLTLSFSQDKSPNFIFLLADDLGWSDLSFEIDTTISNPYKEFFDTQNIHQIAKDGMTFTDAYAPSPICTPSRRAIQFGLTPARQRGTNHASEFEKGDYLSIAQVLKQIDSSYYCAHIGKWGEYMLGNSMFDSTAFHPETIFNYDVSDGVTGNEDGTFFYKPHTEQNFILEVEQDPKQVISTTGRAIEFIQNSESLNKPFFLQLSYYGIHSAYRTTQESYTKNEKYLGLDMEGRIPPELLPMISDLDNSVGIILSVLDSLNIDENTYVIFTSDNGGEKGWISARNYPLRSRKHYLYEGGIRVPFFIKGPNIYPNSYNSEPISLIDLLPSLIDLTDKSYELNYEIDGVSFENELHKQPNKTHRNLIWHKPFSDNQHSAIRVDNFKLLVNWDTIYNKKRIELYDLNSDIGESKNLINLEPEIAASLYNSLISYLEDVNAELPLNWNDFGGKIQISKQSIYICQGDSIAFGAQTLKEKGDYSEFFQVTDKCDSLVILKLNVSPIFNLSISESICQGDSLQFGHRYLTEIGEYTEVFQSVDGCDSIVTLDLNLSPIFNLSISESICQGDSLQFRHRYLTEIGEYTEVFQSVDGCDSIVTLDLNVSPIFNLSISESICQGDSLQFGHRYLTEIGEYTEVFQSVDGCDSIVTLDLNLSPIFNLSISKSICQGDSLQFGHRYLTEIGEYTEVFQSVDGCDSVVVMSLSIDNCRVLNVKPTTNIEVIPNPAKDIIHIKFEESFSGKIALLDASGSILRELKIEKKEDVNINLIDLPRGLYMLLVISNDQNSALKKIIKI